MRTMAGVLLKQPGDWKVVEVDLAPPEQDELLIRMGAAGMCHSDDHIVSGASGVRAIRKAGTCVMVGLGRMADDTGIPVSVREVVLYQKRLQGSLFGASSPAKDIPAMLEFYRQGRLKLDELITTRYSLPEINQGYQDMRDGRNIRGVIVFD